jgi:protein-disulfide isomerase
MSTQAREKAREARRVKELAERQRRQRARVLGIGGLIIGALVAAIVISIIATAATSTTPQAAPSGKVLVVPAAANSDGALTIGNAAAPVKLEIYLDYMCPFCGRFDRANGTELDKLVADGTARVDLHVLNFLDRASNGTRYSTRTANALVTVAEKAPGKVLAFNTQLFASQPEENTGGLTDDAIASLALRAGVPQDVVSLFELGTYEPWIARTTEAAFGSGITGTPTVKINSTVFKGDLYTAGPLTQAVLAAKAK